MATQIFVNLPVKDLDRSKAFFGKLGYSFNPKFTDATAACMVTSEDIYAMLLTELKFKECTSKPIANAKEATEVLVCLSQESKDKVNEIVDTTMRAGAVEARSAMDYGFMFGRSFTISTAISGRLSKAAMGAKRRRQARNSPPPLGLMTESYGCNF
jgi:predicted lactoylglutathione lyase